MLPYCVQHGVDIKHHPAFCSNRNCSSLLRKITSLQEDVKSLKGIPAKDKNDSGLQQVIKKKNEEIRSLKDEIRKLKKQEVKTDRMSKCRAMATKWSKIHFYCKR